MLAWVHGFRLTRRFVVIKLKSCSVLGATATPRLCLSQTNLQDFRKPAAARELQLNSHVTAAKHAFVTPQLAESTGEGLRPQASGNMKVSGEETPQSPRLILELVEQKKKKYHIYIFPFLMNIDWQKKGTMFQLIPWVVLKALGTEEPFWSLTTSLVGIFRGFRSLCSICKHFNLAKCPNSQVHHKSELTWVATACCEG